jgi:hypothetical protein
MPPELAGAELHVQPMDIPLLLRVGRKVRLQFDGWLALVFSGWPGTSWHLWRPVAVIDNIDPRGQYRILVTQPDPGSEAHSCCA